MQRRDVIGGVAQSQHKHWVTWFGCYDILIINREKTRYCLQVQCVHQQHIFVGRICCFSSPCWRRQCVKLTRKKPFPYLLVNIVTEFQVWSLEEISNVTGSRYLSINRLIDSLIHWFVYSFVHAGHFFLTRRSIMRQRQTHEQTKQFQGHLGPCGCNMLFWHQVAAEAHTEAELASVAWHQSTPPINALWASDVSDTAAEVRRSDGAAVSSQRSDFSIYWLHAVTSLSAGSTLWAIKEIYVW